MKILITGATGLIGQKLGGQLARKGHELFVVSRNAERALRELEFPAQVIEGDLVQSKIEITEEIDVVIHLLGESVASGRWSEVRKKSIMDSRVLGTRHLIASLKHAPKMMISASAIGIYGDQKDRILTEESSQGQDFLSQVCIHWESELKLASEKFNQAKLASIRIGIVLAKEGGALKKMLFPFRAGVGGPIGSGQQWMSWIHIEDLVGLFIFVIENKLSGVFNAVAPQPVTNSEFSLHLAKVLNRRTAPKIPGFALKLMLGEMAQLVLASQRVSSEKITRLGFEFKFKNLLSALEDLLGEMKDHTEVFESHQFIPKKKDKIFEYFSEAKNLEELTPKTLKFHIQKMNTPEIQKGSLIDYRLKIHGVPVRWQTLIEEWLPSEKFIDVQLRGPYRKWHHLHSFEDFAGGTLMRDSVHFRLPFGFLGWLFASYFVKADVKKIFSYRRKIIFENFVKLF